MVEPRAHATLAYMPDTPRPPPKLNLLRELAAGADMITAPGALVKARLTKSGAPSGRSIIVLPGFGANDVSTAPMRYFLRQQGHHVEGWAQGFNTGGRGLISDIEELGDKWDVDRDKATAAEAEVPALVDSMIAYTEARSVALGQPIALIGWSLGGFVAREVARDLPDHVEQVITMGSPVIGGPKYTTIAPLFKARKFDLDRVEAEIKRRFAVPIQQPITAIYSKRDGVVGWGAAIDRDSPNVRHIEVNVSHMGLGLNAMVWGLVQDALVSHRA